MSVEARREHLLDAALEIIARDGYGAISIEAIAREAGVTRPVVYNVFDGLDALLLTLLDRQEQRAVQQLFATISPEPGLGDLGTWLDRTIHDLAAMVAGDPLTWRPIFLAYEGTPQVVRRSIGRSREIVRARIEMVTDAALLAGGDQSRSGVDAAVVSHALVAIGEYYGRLILQTPEAVDVDRLTDTVGAVLGALRP